MQQKEVLLIVGVLVVGFFLLNNNGVFSGRTIFDAPQDAVTYPQGYSSWRYAYPMGGFSAGYSGSESDDDDDDYYCACPIRKGDVIVPGHDCPSRATDCTQHTCVYWFNESGWNSQLLIATCRPVV